MEKDPNKELWYTMFAVGHPALLAYQRFHSWLPSPPRCKMCFVPFRGIGGSYMRLRGRRPSSRNPHYCNRCDSFITSNPGGAEVEMAVLFVDVRGSTPLAERMTPTDFSRAINTFCAAATRVLVNTDGFVVDLVGDEVEAVYPPGFSGPEYARKAVGAAAELLQLALPSAPGGPLLELGAGVHCGLVYVGTVRGAEASIEFVQVLGDNVNTAARLASVAKPGEALISDAACTASGVNCGSLEHRSLSLKGKSTPISVRVMRRDSPAAVGSG
jgi:adenylate cyclase